MQTPRHLAWLQPEWLWRRLFGCKVNVCSCLSVFFFKHVNLNKKTKYSWGVRLFFGKKSHQLHRLLKNIWNITLSPLCPVSQGNFLGPKSNIQIKILRTRACLQANKPVHFTDSLIIMLYAKITETSILSVNNNNFPDPWIFMKRSPIPILPLRTWLNSVTVSMEDKRQKHTCSFSMWIFRMLVPLTSRSIKFGQFSCKINRKEKWNILITFSLPRKLNKYLHVCKIILIAFTRTICHVKVI